MTIHLTPVAVAAYWDELEKIAGVPGPVTGWARKAVGGIGDTLSGISRSLGSLFVKAPARVAPGVVNPAMVAANQAAAKDIAGYATRRQPLVGAAGPVSATGVAPKTIPTAAQRVAVLSGRRAPMDPQARVAAEQRFKTMLQSAKQRQDPGALATKVDRMSEQQIRDRLHGKAPEGWVSVAEMNAYGGRGLYNPDAFSSATHAQTEIMPQQFQMQHRLKATRQTPGAARSSMDAELKRIEDYQRAGVTQ